MLPVLARGTRLGRRRCRVARAGRQKPPSPRQCRGCGPTSIAATAGETFCASAGEAQAMGIPAVVQDIGSLRENASSMVSPAVIARD